MRKIKRVWRPFRQLLYTIVLVGILRGCGVLPLDAEEPSIKIEASPKIQLTSSVGSVLIRVTIPRNPQNRVCCVTVEGTMYRSSCWEHDATGAYRKEFWYRDLPAGEYTVIGELQWVEEAKGERKVTLAHDRFVITSGESI